MVMFGGARETIVSTKGNSSIARPIQVVDGNRARLHAIFGDLDQEAAGR